MQSSQKAQNPPCSSPINDTARPSGFGRPRPSAGPTNLDCRALAARPRIADEPRRRSDRRLAQRPHARRRRRPRIPPDRCRLCASSKATPSSTNCLAGCGEIDLVQFMLELAADAYPDLDRVGCLLEIDRLGVACGDHPDCRTTCCIRRRLTAISQLLYDVEGFHGNRDAYYEPREQLPERSARAALRHSDLAGHSCTWPWPPHRAEDVRRQYAGPFRRRLPDQRRRPAVRRPVHQRRRAGPDGLQAAHRADRGQAGCDLRRAFSRRRRRSISRPACCAISKRPTPRRNRWPAVLRVQERLAALLPQIPQERRDLGLVYLRLGQPTKALPVLEHYMSVCGSQQAAALQALAAGGSADDRRNELAVCQSPSKGQDVHGFHRRVTPAEFGAIRDRAHESDTSRSRGPAASGRLEPAVA